MHESLPVTTVADPSTPVGRLEIAEALGVQPNTVTQWRKRGVFPPSTWVVNGFPAWRLGDVLDWHRKRQERLQPPEG
jgi:hypothetical protein